jgi:hypothetical protein
MRIKTKVNRKDFPPVARLCEMRPFGFCALVSFLRMIIKCNSSRRHAPGHACQGSGCPVE